MARGKIYHTNNRHKPIPEGWAIDKLGNPTTDPKAALEGFILPMAGHKGYVLGAMVDVLSGVLSGSGFLEGVHGPYDPVSHSAAGHLLLGLKIEAFQPVAEFHARMESYIESLKAVPLAAGHTQVFYPGEMETQADEENRAQSGLLLATDTLIDLQRNEKK
jgi:LDH2 family malate/lactate/ureidoglycolate dehydrogenase